MYAANKWRHVCSQDDGEEPQECLEIDFSCDYESDVGSVESSEFDIYDVEIFSD